MPLFVEELTKTVLESGLLTDAGDRYELAGPLPPLAIPATLHDSLMARLDRLAPVKEVAQTGAVIGREFSHELLAAVSPLSRSRSARRPRPAGRRRADLPPRHPARRHLQLQARAGPGRRLPVPAQEQAPAAARADRRALEERFPDTRDQTPEVLGYHFSEAGMVNEAVEYWHRAGEKAAERSANLEAIGISNRRLSFWRRYLRSVARGAELRLLTLLRSAQLVTKGHGAEEVATYPRARAAGCSRTSKYQPILSQRRLGLWLFHNARGDFDRGR